MTKAFLISSLSVLPLLSPAPVSGDIVVGGPRQVTVHVPPSYDSEVPMPLVFLLHGFTNTATGIENYWRLTPLADERGFLYVVPQGTRDSQGRTFWDGTDGCCNADPEPVDDSGYLRGLVAEIDAQLNVDRDRIFFTGFSNGGFMSHRMACDHADVVAAIASQAGATFLDPDRCTAAAPVHILQIHGTNDTVIRYGGGTFLSFASYPGAMATVSQWATYNRCLLEAETVGERLDIAANVAGAETTIVRFVDVCDTGGSAELWTIPGAGHGPSFVADGSTTNLAVHVMDWLLSHPKRPAPVASFTVTPESGVGPLDVIVDASASTKPEGTSITTYLWDFGSGVTAGGATASSTYESTGRHSISLVVITDDGRVSLRTTRSVSVLCPQGDIEPWTAGDVGEPGFPGAAQFESSDPDGSEGDDLLVCSGGGSVGGRADELFFAHQEVSGDFRIMARFSEISAKRFVKAGVMFRSSLAADARFAAMLLETGATSSRYRFRYREAPGELVRSFLGDAFETAGYVRLERRGNIFSGSSSLDGESWIPLPEQTIDEMSETILVGFAVAASGVSEDVLEPVRVRITPLEAGPISFLRGDCNDDGEVDMSDAIFSLRSFFRREGSLVCDDSCDSNDDGAVDISDAINTVFTLFVGGVIPAPGVTTCGADPTDDGLGCAETACR